MSDFGEKASRTDSELLRFWTCPLLGILKIREKNVSETASFFHPQVKSETHTRLGTLERANLNQFT
jgi:hypothetical protein